MKLPRDLSGAQAIRALERLGFAVSHQTGSHVRLMKPGLRVTVPIHKSLAPGTLQSIVRQARVSLEEFMDAL